MAKIVVLDDYQGRASELGDWGRLGARGEVVFVRDHLDGDALLDALGGAEVVIAMRERTAFDRELLSRLPELRLLVTTGLQNASIDVGAANEFGITVSGTRSGSEGTIELTWALLLGAVKELRREDAAMRRGAWQEHLSGDLAGSTLGLLGLGRLGGLMVPIAKAFKMDVIAWSQNLTRERCDELGVELVTKDELFGRADVISIHLKLSERTRGLVGAAELAKMRPGAILVNTSRGPIVDEAALVAALRAATIAGAALDVYDVEPLPADHVLRSLDNVVITPHLGYASVRNFTRYFAESIEDIEAFFEGAPIRVLEAG
jgi:phosphoglycerate dehydrogenase-like enzyme